MNNGTTKYAGKYAGRLLLAALLTGGAGALPGSGYAMGMGSGMMGPGMPGTGFLGRGTMGPGTMSPGGATSPGTDAPGRERPAAAGSDVAPELSPDELTSAQLDRIGEQIKTLHEQETRIAETKDVEKRRQLVRLYLRNIQAFNAQRRDMLRQQSYYRQSDYDWPQRTDQRMRKLEKLMHSP